MYFKYCILSIGPLLTIVKFKINFSFVHQNLICITYNVEFGG